MGTPKAHSRNVSDLPLRLFVRDCTRALSARPLVCPCSPPTILDSFSYLSCVFAARSASVSHRSAISMKNDLCAEVRAASAPPSIRPSPPGTVQGLLRRAHILSAQHQRNHGTVQTQTSTTPHDQSGTQGTRHSGTGAGHHADHQAADEDQTAVRTLR